MAEYDEFIASLELLGEPEVRSQLSQGVWASRRKQWAEDWLSHTENSRQEARDEIALSISKEANSTAKSALRISKIALFAAIAAAILGAAATLIAAFIGKPPSP
jgi:hypothetical protein